MPVFLYNIFILFYHFAIWLSSAWNKKAKNWIIGRKKIFERIDIAMGASQSIGQLIWIHCSSLGEFEQGRPVLKEIRHRYPGYKIFITFFSPSGFEIKKNDDLADFVFYLPPDSKKNAGRFLELLQPSLVIFIKYEYWYHYLAAIKKRNINCLLVSAVFRKDQAFFKWYGSLQRTMLTCFTEIFVQNEQSKALLETISIRNCQLGGDTRFDRVKEIADHFEAIPAIESFIMNRKCIVAGSTWKEDEGALQQAFSDGLNESVALIIAPHEIATGHLSELRKIFPGSTFFSELSLGIGDGTRTLIIDNIGMLARLYKYAWISYIGGGFSKDGVHNVLEAAVYGKPVVFAPNFHKYREAEDLVSTGGAQSFSTAADLRQIVATMISNDEDYRKRSEAAGQYVRENTGATKKIMDYIEEKRLLTR